MRAGCLVCRCCYLFLVGLGLAPAAFAFRGSNSSLNLTAAAAAHPGAATPAATPAAAAATTPQALSAAVGSDLTAAAAAAGSQSASNASTTAAAAAADSSSSSSSGVYMDGKTVSSLTQSISSAVYTAEDIKKILPHRYPFLLVDKVLFFKPGEAAVGVKQITNNENQFNGHFPERAIMPGVLQVEALAQLAGIVALQPPLSNGSGLFFFAGANGIKWKKPVVPGDSLVMEVQLLSWKEKFGLCKFSGRGFVDGQPAVEVAEMTFAFNK